MRKKNKHYYYMTMETWMHTYQYIDINAANAVIALSISETERTTEVRLCNTLHFSKTYKRNDCLAALA